MIPYLTSEKSHLPVTKNQSDIISSIFTIGLIMGYLLNPLIIDRIGRKKTLLIYTIPQMISWLLIIFIKKYSALLIGRIICGFGYGGGICALTVYLSEIGTLKNRGIFLVMIPVFINLGFLCVMIIGAYSTFNILNCVMLLVPLIFCVTFVFIPDSLYFREKNQEDEKMTNLLNSRELENMNFEKYEKYEQIFESGKNDIETKIDDKGGNFQFKEMRFYKLLSNSCNRRALLILVILSATIPLSGAVPVLFYTQQLLSYSGFSIRAEECTIILAGITIIACLISVPLVERVKRKVILLYSGILCTIGMIIVGIFFLMEKQNIDVTSLRWVPLFGLTLYSFMNTFGFLNLFYIFQGELFSSEVKSQAVTTCKIVITFFMFLSLVRFQEMVNILGLHVIFFVFAGIAAMGTYFVFIITPETKGKSVEEIQLLMKSRKFFF